MFRVLLQHFVSDAVTLRIGLGIHVYTLRLDSAVRYELASYWPDAGDRACCDWHGDPGFLLVHWIVRAVIGWLAALLWVGRRLLPHRECHDGIS